MLVNIGLTRRVGSNTSALPGIWVDANNYYWIDQLGNYWIM